jgi:hypothetical protein
MIGEKSSESICGNCFELPKRHPIAAFIFVFSAVFLGCLFKERFLGYHKATIVDVLLALLGGAFAAYGEARRCATTHRRGS